MLHISQNVRKNWPKLETDIATKYVYVYYGQNEEWNAEKKCLSRNSLINAWLFSYLQFNYCNCGLFRPEYSIKAMGDLNMIFLNYRKIFIVYTFRSISGLACLYFRQIWKIFENCSSKKILIMNSKTIIHYVLKNALILLFSWV